MPKDPLQEFLDSHPEPEAHVSPDYGKQLDDFLKATPTPEVKAEPLSGGEIASRMVKGLGYGVVRGMMDLPASIGDFIWKNVPGAQAVPWGQIPGSGFMNAVPAYRNATAKAEANKEELGRGILTPETNERMRRGGNLLTASADPLNPATLPVWLAGKAMGSTNKVLAEAPDVLGSVVGSLPANALLYGGAAKTFGVAAAKNIAARTGLHLAASTTATAAQSYLVQLRDGESSWMNVVRDLGVNAAFETLGLHGLRNAWKNELGKEAENLAGVVAKSMKIDPAMAELKVTQIRGGGGIQEPQVAQAVVQAAKGNPKIANTPVVFQAKKSLSEYWEKVVPSSVTVNKELGPDHGVSFDVLVDGQKVTSMHVQGSKVNPSRFTDVTDKLASRIVELTQQGKSIKLDNVQVAYGGTWSRFVNRLRGEPAHFGTLSGRKLTAFEEQLGSAPRGSIAESGAKPAAGTKLVVQEPGKAQRVVEAVGEVGRDVRKDVGKEETKAAIGPLNQSTGENPTADWVTKITTPIPPKGMNRKDAVMWARNVAGSERLSDTQYHQRVDELLMKSGHTARTEVRPANAKVRPAQQRAPAMPEEATIPVKDLVTGQMEFVPTRNTKVWLFQKNAPVKLAAHPDGTDRHFMVDLNAKDAFMEPADGKAGNSFFRSGLFSEVDRDGDLNNGPRGFIHPDGSVTLSVTKGERFETLLQGDPQVESGPLDRVGFRPMKDTPYKTPGERYAHASTIGSPSESFPRNVVVDPKTKQTRFIQIDATGARSKFSGFGAGFQPTKTRDVQYQGEPGRPGSFAKVQMRSHVKDRLVPSALEKPEEAPVTARMKKRSQIANPEEGEDRTFVRGAAGIPMERYAVDKAPLVNDPALIDAKKAAEILLTQKNVDPGTKVRVVVTDSTHSGGHDAPFSWTLEELAHAEPGLYDMPELHAAAVRRGYTAIPHGAGVTLRDTSSGAEHVFEHRLEAAAFLGKQRVQELGPRIEEGAESALKLGWLRSFDGDLDGGAFAPRQAQKLALDALVANKRAGVAVWTPTEEAIAGLEAKAHDVKLSPKVRAKLGAEIEEKSGLHRALVELEGKLGVRPGTFRHLLLPETQEGKQKVLIYNRDAVERLKASYGKQIEQLLKVDVSNPETMIRGLANRPGGVDILSHPDPESGIVYAHLKSTNQREAMMLGKVIQDPTTARPYRIYDPQVKAHFLTGQGGTPDPEEFIRDVELKDVVQVPPEHSFEGIDPNMPPPIMETPLIGAAAGGGGKDVDWKSGLGQWFQTRLELFRKWERDSGVPFYSTYSDLEQSRDNAVREFSPFRQYLDTARGKVRKAGDRTNIQLLTEAVLSNDTKTAQVYSTKMDPKHVALANELADKWKEYLKGIGFQPNEVEASFRDFAALRKKGGDFKAYAGAKPALPKMMDFLRRQLNQANSPLTLSERETDFYSLGVRLSRLLAYEKHLTPSWNAAAKRMMDATKSVNIPEDVFNNFKSYMHEVMHTPDDVHIASVRTMRLGWQKADAIVRKMSRGKLSLGVGHSDDEALDLFGALSTLGYASNLAWNPASIIQQYMQTLQTTLPALGGKYTKKGLGFAVRWLKDPKLQEDMARRGIAGHSTLAQPLAMFQDFVDSKGALASGGMRAVNKFVAKGSQAFQVGDDFNRVAAYMGKHQAVMDYGQEYLAAVKSGKNPNAWQDFRENTKLDLQDEKNGPVTRMVKEALDGGDVVRAAHIAADHFQKFTQFVYSRGNNPRVLDGTLGRFLGQYGTYPMAYANYLTHLALGGDKKLTKNKIAALTYMIGVNTGMMGAMSVVFNADASKWTTWHSFWYRGGPYAELAQEMLYVASQYGQGRSNDPVASIYAGRIAGQIGTQMLPGIAGARHIGKAALSMMQGDWQGSAREMMGLPAAESGPGPMIQ